MMIDLCDVCGQTINPDGFFHTDGRLFCSRACSLVDDVLRLVGPGQGCTGQAQRAAVEQDFAAVRKEALREMADFFDRVRLPMLFTWQIAAALRLKAEDMLADDLPADKPILTPVQLAPPDDAG